MKADPRWFCGWCGVEAVSQYAGGCQARSNRLHRWHRIGASA